MIFPTPEEYTVLVLSLKVGLLCVVISLPFAVLLGWVLARKNFRGKLILDGLCHLPLVLPPVVVGYLLLLLLGTPGFSGPNFERLVRRADRIYLARCRISRRCSGFSTHVESRSPRHRKC